MAGVEKEILVFSDSHGDATLMRRALRAHPDADVIHLGDGLADLDELDLSGHTVYRVMGNHEDFYSRFTGMTHGGAVNGILDVCGHRIFYTHGHREHVKSGYDFAALRAYTEGCDILLFGHTHEMHDEYLPLGEYVGGTRIERPLRIFNPGTAGSGWECSCGLLTFRGTDVLTSFIKD